ncbi:MAG TPA: RNA 2'-phosphotransferase [Anaerohalosphaeraceae bacterium]|jgi:putative RNA 2'-phosphotransferase|nr:RNA 2'-phosphotransferase [Anaerohalosphaeraceae bacterium]HRT52139.1 RNA 2'-phosphotransferase [Anaerohalosphaeraceae bacterium]HRT88250.1 RNA 2'-phosphotransferase [Anaerohalosphaeraceae bacterium]
MDVDYVQLSKTVSHALRHEPWLYELELDNDGWVSVDSLLAALRQESPAWRDLCESDLAAMIAASSKQRHEMTNGRIRALYGHSLPGKLRREPAAPPTRLFHGTAPATLPAIRRDGLLPMERQYVHLSADLETAQAVGKRKASEPVILIVKAGQAHQGGVAFYEGNDKVWLADRVPPEFIE